MTDRLAALAQSRGLGELCTRLQDPRTVEPPADDPALTEKPAQQLEELLLQMIRRGGSPALGRGIRSAFESRPLELGLASWDLLCMTLLGADDGADEGALRAAAARVRPVLPAPGTQGVSGQRLSTQLFAAEVTALSLAGASDDQLAELLRGHSIGAYEELRRRGRGEALREQGTSLERTRQFAQLLHLARLETLASYYLHYLWSAFGWTPALRDLCDVLLDCGAHDRLPAITGDGDLTGYVAARSAMQTGRSKPYLDEHLSPSQGNWLRMRNQQVAATAPWTRMAEGEIGIAHSELPYMYEVVDLIADAHPAWRYGARVRVAMHAWVKNPGTDARVEDFLSQFGSDPELWRTAFDGDFGSALHRHLSACAIREATALPHAAWAWVGVIRTHCIDPAAPLDELSAHLRRQCDLGA